MKNKFFIVITGIFMILPALHGENTDREFILSSMTFPEAETSTGSLLNNPFFCLDLHNRKTDPEMIRKMIDKAEKETEKNPVPESLFQLGNLYKEIHDYEKASKKYKLSLKAYDSAENKNTDFYRELLIKGDIYFYLAKTDYRSDRNGYLDKASYLYRTAIELKPQNDLWIRLGDSYLASGKNNEALYCYRHVPDKGYKIDFIYSRLQAVSFQADYNKLTEELSWQKFMNLPVDQLTDFENIQTAINNSSGRDKDILKIQHYVYLIRLLLLKNESFTMDHHGAAADIDKIFTGEEKLIFEEAEKHIRTAGKKCLRPASYEYLMGIICYLKSDYRNAVAFFGNSLKQNEYPELVYKDLLAVSGKLNDEALVKKIISDKITKYPDASDYLTLGSLEFKKNNLKNAEMLCNQALKINNSYAEAFSGLAVIFARNENYIPADEMVKKGNYLIQDKKSGRMKKNRMIVNEAAISLLKNEKERAYILLKLVLTADKDEKADKLYNRFFKKNGKIQN